MAAQLDYGFEMQKGTPGGLYDLSVHTVVSRTVESADGEVLNGTAVAVGTEAGVGIIKPASNTAAFEGIVVRGGVNAENDKEGVATIVKGATVSILTYGKIWARLVENDAPAYNDKAYAVLSGDNAGLITKTSGDTTVEIGVFIGSADNGLAPVFIQ